MNIPRKRCLEGTNLNHSGNNATFAGAQHTALWLRKTFKLQPTRQEAYIGLFSSLMTRPVVFCLLTHSLGDSHVPTDYRATFSATVEAQHYRYCGWCESIPRMDWLRGRFLPRDFPIWTSHAGRIKQVGVAPILVGGMCLFRTILDRETWLLPSWPIRIASHV